MAYGKRLFKKNFRGRKFKGKRRKGRGKKLSTYRMSRGGGKL